MAGVVNEGAPAGRPVFVLLPSDSDMAVFSGIQALSRGAIVLRPPAIELGAGVLGIRRYCESYLDIGTVATGSGAVIVGYCVAGLGAIELGRILDARGQEPSHVLLIDTLLPEHYNPNIEVMFGNFSDGDPCWQAIRELDQSVRSRTVSMQDAQVEIQPLLRETLMRQTGAPRGSRALERTLDSMNRWYRGYAEMIAAPVDPTTVPLSVAFTNCDPRYGSRVEVAAQAWRTCARGTYQACVLPAGKYPSETHHQPFRAAELRDLLVRLVRTTL